jgi:hypothetical protein
VILERSNKETINTINFDKLSEETKSSTHDGEETG